jgi:alpha-tubulin suppressor-like RCC1 family protein
MVTSFEDQEISQITAQSDISAVINKFGELYTWGSVRNGSMLTPKGETFNRNLDEPMLFTTREHEFKSIAVGKDHCAMVTENGKVMTMGSMDHGKLGHEPIVKAKLSNYEKQRTNSKDTNSRAKVGFTHGEIANKKIVQVSCGF